MPVENITITRAAINDAEMLVELSVTTFCDTFALANKQEDMDMYIKVEMNATKLTGELNDERNIFFIVWIGKTAVGFAKMRNIYKPGGLESHNPIEIERFYIRRQYHGRKIGSALMDHCMAYAISNHHDALWLGVWEYNYSAIHFYKRRGFELFGSHPFILGNDHQTDVLMKKDL